MMETFFVLVVLGCSHGFQECEAVPTQARLYETRIACEANIEPVLRAQKGAPLGIASCEAITGGATEASEQHWSFSLTDGLNLASPAS